MIGHTTKWFASDMAGAPVLSGQAGALLSVLSACLVDGFNLLTLDSLVISNGVATASKAGHGYKYLQVVEIGGASPAGLNGQWRISNVTTNTFSFAVSGISDQSATGTITAKTPGCGWEIPFSGTNVAIYRSTSAMACGNHAVKVTDTGTTTATCVAAEDWTDVSTPINSIRTFYIPKSATADGTARGWNIVADDRTIYIAVSFTGGRRDLLTFGDFESLLPGDGHSFLVRAPSSASVANLGHESTIGYSTVLGVPDFWAVASRNYAQVAGPVPLRQVSMCSALYDATPELSLAIFSTGQSGNKQFKFSASHGYTSSGSVISYSSVYGMQAPSPVDGGLHFVPVYQVEGEVWLAQRIRGKSRGLLHIVETRPLTADVMLIEGVESVDGGVVLGFRTQSAASAYNASAYMYPETHIAISLGSWN